MTDQRGGVTVRIRRQSNYRHRAFETFAFQFVTDQRRVVTVRDKFHGCCWSKNAGDNQLVETERS